MNTSHLGGLVPRRPVTTVFHIYWWLFAEPCFSPFSFVCVCVCVCWLNRLVMCLILNCRILRCFILYGSLFLSLEQKKQTKIEYLGISARQFRLGISTKNVTYAEVNWNFEILSQRLNVGLSDGLYSSSIGGNELRRFAQSHTRRVLQPQCQT